MRRKQLVGIGVIALSVIALIASYVWRARIVTPAEIAIVRIPLSGGPERPDAEISGLAWYRDDTLVLLPQYPSRFESSVFAVNASAIEASIASRAQGRLEVRRVPLDVSGLEEVIPHFDGFEAIA